MQITDSTRYAILIGIDHYSKMHYSEKDKSLQFCCNDVEKLKEVLEEYCCFKQENIFQITSPKASPNNKIKLHIEKAVSDIKKKFTKSDLLFIYYSGHGENKDGDSFLDFDTELFPTNGLAEIAHNLKPKQTAIVIDACYQQIDLSIGKGNPQKITRRLFNDSSALIALTSSIAEREAYQYFNLKHSILTYFFIKTIKNQDNYFKGKKLEFSRICDIAKREVHEYHQNSDQIVAKVGSEQGVFDFAFWPYASDKKQKYRFYNLAQFELLDIGETFFLNALKNENNSLHEVRILEIDKNQYSVIRLSKDARHLFQAISANSSIEFIGKAKFEIEKLKLQIIKSDKSTSDENHSKELQSYLIITNAELNEEDKSEVKSLIKEIFPKKKIYGSKWLLTHFEQNPTLKIKYPNSYLSSQSSIYNITNKAKESGYEFKSFLLPEEIERKVALYVTNRYWPKALNLINQKEKVILTGPPGIGKSTLAEMLVYYFLEKNYRLLIVDKNFSDYDRNTIRTIGESGQKTIIYIDDFLGQNYFDLKNNPSKDSHLAEILELSQAYENIKLILTTRKVNLEQAKTASETVKRNIANFDKFQLELKELNVLHKGKILFKHLSLSKLDKSFKNEILKKEFFSKICHHKNFNPRLIEFLTDRTYVLTKLSKHQEYRDLITDSLKNPQEIWDDIYRKKISKYERELILALFSLGESASIDQVEDVYSLNIESIPNSNYDEAASFNESLRNLLGSFLDVEKHGKKTIIKFKNPSFVDYLINYINIEKQRQRKMIRIISSLDQVFRFYKKDEEEIYQRGIQIGPKEIKLLIKHCLEILDDILDNNSEENKEYLKFQLLDKILSLLDVHSIPYEKQLLKLFKSIDPHKIVEKGTQQFNSFYKFLGELSYINSFNQQIHRKNNELFIALFLMLPPKKDYEESRLYGWVDPFNSNYCETQLIDWGKRKNPDESTHDRSSMLIPEYESKHEAILRLFKVFDVPFDKFIKKNRDLLEPKIQEYYSEYVEEILFGDEREIYSLENGNTRLELAKSLANEIETDLKVPIIPRDFSDISDEKWEEIIKRNVEIDNWEAEQNPDDDHYNQVSNTSKIQQELRMIFHPGF